MQWQLNVGVGAGPILFGMSASGLVNFLHENHEKFKRAPDDEETLYAYDDLGVQVGINCEDVVVTVIVFQPNELLLSGVQLLGRPLKDVILDLQRNSINVVPVDAGAWVRLDTTSITFVEVDGVVDGVEITRAE